MGIAKDSINLKLYKHKYFVHRNKIIHKQQRDK